ncbi:MAG: XcyI family restriction endonuclease [Ruminococcus sp.]|nr:XcyI family restriction endonuclease [Ruminococcus sp.]
MADVPYEVTKESYILKSTFFYNKLKSNGYFELFMKVQNMAQLEGATLNWEQRDKWNISAAAWTILAKNKIDPMLVFLHPKVFQINPTFLKYYRSVAMISQKGLKALSGVSNVDKIENGKVEPGRMSQDTINAIVRIINEILSLVVSFATDLDNNELQGMMYATAGTNIDGSWRNSIGAEGERVIRSIILKEVLAHKEVLSITDRQSKTTAIDNLQADKIIDDIDSIKSVTLINGYSILFSSEPDVSMFNDAGDIVGVIEIKAGLDPAGALERLGAMLKSFENTLAEYPEAVTILVASCITKEVEARLGAAMSVRQKYITTDITSSENNQRKFANRMRKILNLLS